MAVRIVRGVNDLLSTHPVLVQEWGDNQKTPEDVSAGSTYYANWVCEEGHSYIAEVRKRAIRGQGCPFCSGQRPIKGVNDLATTHPHLAAEWSTKNTIFPHDLTAGSGKKIWWKCKSGHEWEEVVELRGKRGYGCPFCSGHRTTTEKSLAKKFPGLLDEWDYEKNDLEPHKVSYASHLMTWWKCEQGHSWKTPTYNRTIYAKSCPICAGQVTLSGFNDLESQFPEVARDFDEEKNRIAANQVHCGSANSFWWKCSEGHSWMTTVQSRTRQGNGCRECSGHHTSKAEEELAGLIERWGLSVERNRRDLIPPYEIDIYVPKLKLGIEFNGLIWHSEKFTRDKDRHHKKWVASQSIGIRLLQIWEDDWNHRKQIVISMIRSKLGLEKSIGARKTQTTVLTSSEANQFLDKHHIQGSVMGCTFLGLTKDETIIAVLALRNSKNEISIERYATAVQVAGGFTKLLAQARRQYPNKDFVTFADLCISQGEMYEKCGFELVKELPPDYMYVNRSRREHKFNYRLKRFKEDDTLIYQDDLTEHELALLNGLYRIYDAGKLKFMLVAESPMKPIAKERRGQDEETLEV